MRAYVLTSGDSEKFWIESAVTSQADRRRYWTEDLNRNSSARRSIFRHWIPLNLRAVSRRGKVNQNDFADVHGYGDLKGFERVISDRCRRVLEAEFPSACTYLPLTIEGAPEVYWALWVNEVVDAIDTAQSDVGLVAPGFSMLGRRTYRADAIGAHAIFRLPMIYAAEGDHVTDRFKEVVERHKMTNFSFWDRTRDGAVDSAS
jgi:hypothetical protein